MANQLVGKGEVIEKFGCLPEFCDSEIRSISFSLDNRSIVIVLFYIDSDKDISAEFKIDFFQVSNLSLSNLRDRNYIDRLAFESDGKFSVWIESSYGLGGRFDCGRITLEFRDGAAEVEAE